MKIRSYLLFTILIICQFSCKDQSGPSMFMGTSEHTGKHNSISVKNSPRTLWKFKTSGSVVSSPVVQDNILFVGSDDQKMYALGTETGAVVWSFKTQGKIRSTPLVTNEKVLLLSYDGYFYCLNKQDGRLLWKFKTGGESIFKVKDYFNGTFEPDFWDFYLSSAVVKGDNVYFGSSDSNVYALNINTGKQVWKFKTEGSVHSSPAISENSLVIGSWDGKVYCLNVVTGTEKWVFKTDQDFENYIWLGVQASPSIENGVVYIGSRDAKFYALELESGKSIWEKDAFDRSWMPSSAAIGTSNIFTGSSDSMSFFSINKFTGAVNYATKTKAYTFSSPAIDAEMGYIGAANGRLFGIELASGEIKWEYKTIGAKTDTIKMFDEGGKIDQIKAQELTKEIDNMPDLTAIYEGVFESVGAVLSSPVISDQVVYFGSSDGYVYALTDKD